MRSSASRRFWRTGLPGRFSRGRPNMSALIRQSGEHLLHLINEILDLARIDAGKLDLHEEVIDPRRLVDSASSLVNDRASTGLLRLTVDIEEDMPAVEGRRDPFDGDPPQPAVERHQIHRARRDIKRLGAAHGRRRRRVRRAGQWPRHDGRPRSRSRWSGLARSMAALPVGMRAPALGCLSLENSPSSTAAR